MLMEVNRLDIALVIVLVVQLGVRSMGSLIVMGSVVTVIIRISVAMLIGSRVNDMLTAILRSDGVEDGVFVEVHGLHIALVVVLVVQFGVRSVIRFVVMITVVVILIVVFLMVDRGLIGCDISTMDGVVAVVLGLVNTVLSNHAILSVVISSVTVTN